MELKNTKTMNNLFQDKYRIPTVYFCSLDCWCTAKAIVHYYLIALAETPTIAKGDLCVVF